MQTSLSPRHSTAVDRSSALQRKPKRISLTLNQATYERLQVMSDEQGRSQSNLCAYVLEAAMHE